MEDVEQIRKRLEETKSSLAENLEKLESQVAGVVNTVETAQGSVVEALQVVRNGLDVRSRVESHPWLAVGGAFVAGTAAGLYFFKSSKQRAANLPELDLEAIKVAAERAAERVAEVATPRPRGLMGFARDYLGQLGAQAVHTLMATALRTVLHTAVESMQRGGDEDGEAASGAVGERRITPDSIRPAAGPTPTWERASDYPSRREGAH